MLIKDLINDKDGLENHIHQSANLFELYDELGSLLINKDQEKNQEQIIALKTFKKYFSRKDLLEKNNFPINKFEKIATISRIVFGMLTSVLGLFLGFGTFPLYRFVFNYIILGIISLISLICGGAIFGASLSLLNKETENFIITMNLLNLKKLVFKELKNRFEILSSRDILFQLTSNEVLKTTDEIQYNEKNDKNIDSASNSYSIHQWIASYKHRIIIDSMGYIGWVGAGFVFPGILLKFTGLPILFFLAPVMATPLIAIVGLAIAVLAAGSIVFSLLYCQYQLAKRLYILENTKAEISVLDIEISSLKLSYQNEIAKRDTISDITQKQEESLEKTVQHQVLETVSVDQKLDYNILPAPTPSYQPIAPAAM